MSRIVYAVPGVTPQGSEIADLNQARALARAKNVHLFAYREEDDGSLTMLGSQTPKGSIVKFKANPLKEFRGPSFHDTLRRLGNTGHSVYRDLKTGQEEKKPKTVYFSDGEGALQALAVFLVLEGADTRGVVDISGGRDHQKQASVRFPDGRIYSATLTPERNDYWIMGEGIERAVRWGTWANAGVYPDTKLFKKSNPRRMNPREFLVYHADHGVNPEQMAYIQSVIANKNPTGFFAMEVKLPRALGLVRNALYGPMSGDPPVRESEVDYRPRGDRPWSDRVVAWPTRPIDYVQAIGMPDQNDPNKIVLFTVYGGPLAPQHPDDPGNRDLAASKKFWSEHALSLEQWEPKKNPKPQMTRRASIHEQVAEMSPSSSLPEMADLPQKLKVVVGPKSYASPTLLREGARAFEQMTGQKYDELKTPRHHPALVWLAENRPAYFYSYLKEPGFRLYDAPGGLYEIRDYDGWESFHTPDTIQWVRIPRANSR